RRRGAGGGGGGGGGGGWGGGGGGVWGGGGGGGGRGGSRRSAGRGGKARVDRGLLDLLAVHEFTEVLAQATEVGDILGMMADSILRVAPYDACEIGRASCRESE